MPHLEPEYPALTEIQLQEKTASRLARSRRRFGSEQLVVGLPKLCASTPWLSEIIGKIGSFSHANASEIDSWLQHWRMPTETDPRPDVQSSLAVFVGVKESDDMPVTHSLRTGPYICITTKYIRICTRLSETFPFFAYIIKNENNHRRFNNARSLLFEYLSNAPEPSPQLVSQMREHRDAIFSLRTTAAAVRWGIAHEMAHAVAGKKDREKAYKQVASLYPNMEEEQWEPKREELEDYRASVDLYRDEIACDLLALDFVLASPFATNDLMTQVSGSLLALEALKWDGWFTDESKVSPTHPSPALRFKIIMRAWLEKLSDPETWNGRDAPGPLGIDDIAHWYAFHRWSSGEYGLERDGSVWGEDIRTVRGVLRKGVPNLGVDPVYIVTADGTLRVAVDRQIVPIRQGRNV